MQTYKYVCTMAPSLQQSTFLKDLFKQSQGTVRVNLIKPAKNMPTSHFTPISKEIKLQNMFCIENVMFYFFCIFLMYCRTNMHILPLHSHFCNAKTSPKMAFISTYIYLFCRIVTWACFCGMFRL